MHIEIADVSDATAILELQHLCFQSEAAIYDDFVIAPLTETLDQIKAEFERRVFLKAMEGNRIIGSVCGYTEDETCYISRLIVHPDYQNMGMGKKLMLSIEAAFKNLRRFELFTGDRSLKNLSLYKKLDYKEFKREKVNDKLTFVYMEKIVRI